MESPFEYPLEPLLSDREVLNVVEKIKVVCKGSEQDRQLFAGVFVKLTALQVSQVSQFLKKNHGENLVELLKREYSGYVGDLLIALSHDPLELDCERIHSFFKV